MTSPHTPSPAAHRAPAVDLLVLAGGSAERLGGRDKAKLQVGGVGLLDRLLDKVGAGAEDPLGGRVVVVGRTEVPPGTLRTVEDPPGGGPVAGIEAGLRLLDRASGAEWVAVVAVDQPGAGAVLGVLRDQLAVLPDEVDAVGPFTTGGRREWLLALYRRNRLHDALTRVGTVRGASVGALVADLRWVLVSGTEEHLGDVDTTDDLVAWDRRLTEDLGSQPATPGGRR